MADLVARLEVRLYGAAATAPANLEAEAAQVISDALRNVDLTPDSQMFTAPRVEILTPDRPRLL